MDSEEPLEESLTLCVKHAEWKGNGENLGKEA
jgi:hypothetical protein